MRLSIPSRRSSCGLLVVAAAAACATTSTAFSPPLRSTMQTSSAASSRRRISSSTATFKRRTILHVSATTDEIVDESTKSKDASPLTEASLQTTTDSSSSSSSLASKLKEKMGTVDPSRIAFPEYDSGQVPRMFSSLSYQSDDTNGGSKLTAVHVAGSVVGAAALVTGTTIGAGVLALPAATAAVGFVPSSLALTSAWIYMTMSGLLIAELTLNRIGNTGRPGVGLLDLYEDGLAKPWNHVGTAAYFFLHYAVMVAYIAQGGNNLAQGLAALGSSVDLSSLPPGSGQVGFAALAAAALYTASPKAIEKVNNVLVLGVIASFVGIMALGAGSMDVTALMAPANQHGEHVLDCLPILFLSLVFQNVVPTVVAQLEGDRTKITQAIVAGTTLPFLMFLAWNAVVLGNVLGMDNVDLTLVDPVALLQQQGGGAVGPLVSVFSSLALTTSIVGFTYGLLDAWTDVFKISTKSQAYETYKLPLFGLVFGPPLALSLANPDIFFQALDIGGAFGVSTLFLVLPPLMVWNERYRQTEKSIVTTPMVPFGKIPLGSMWKAAGTLILEQGAEKLGVFDFIQEHYLR